MSKIKKILIAFSIAVILYGLLSYVYNTYIKEPYVSAFVLKKDLAKNEEIKTEDLEEIKILELSVNKNYLSKESVLKEKGQMFSSYGLRAGQIILKESIAKKSEIVSSVEGFEYISLDVKGASEAMSYRLKKGNIVNIYFTSKTKQVDQIIAEKEKVYGSNSPDSSITCKLLNNVEIVEVYDNKGVSNSTEGLKVFDTLVIRVSSKDALMISNLKSQGEFNFTIIR